MNYGKPRGASSLNSPCPGLCKPCPVRGASRPPPTPSRNGRPPFLCFGFANFPRRAGCGSGRVTSHPEARCTPDGTARPRVFLDLALAVNRVPWFGRFGLTTPARREIGQVTGSIICNFEHRQPTPQHWRWRSWRWLILCMVYGWSSIAGRGQGFSSLSA